MAECKDELVRRDALHGEEQAGGDCVVVSLEAHRRWRSRHLWDETRDFNDEPDPLIDGEGWIPEWSAAEEKTETVLKQEPSLCLAGMVALTAFGLIVGLYWVFTAAMAALVDFSFAYL